MFLKCDADLKTIVNIVYGVYNLIRIGVPILLILFGSIDLGKAVISSKEDEMKKAQGALIKRFIYAVAVFLVVTLVSFVMRFFIEGNDKDADPSGLGTWRECWPE